MAMQSVVHPARQSRSRKALAPEEILMVLKIASESKRNLAMILLAYRHGMRASEVCDLRLADLDLKIGQKLSPLPIIQGSRSYHHGASSGLGLPSGGI